MNKITSVHNKTISDIAKLKITKHRKSSGLFCAEGHKLVKEVISCGGEAVFCFVSETADTSILDGLINEDIVFTVTEAVMKKISSMSTPPDMILVAKEKRPLKLNFDDDLIIALDCIQDPANMGAIIRSAEAFGVNTVIVGEGSCDIYSQKNLRSAMGSIFRLNILTENLTAFLPILKKHDYEIIGAGLDRGFQTVDKLGKYPKKVLVIGNEGNGISADITDICDSGLFIPMVGKNESLNAAVAASIIMWENLRQKNE